MSKVKGKAAGNDDKQLKIRITLTSTDVKRLEKGMFCFIHLVLITITLGGPKILLKHHPSFIYLHLSRAMHGSF